MTARMRRLPLALALAIALLFVASPHAPSFADEAAPAHRADQSAAVAIYLFYTDTCPHCLKAKRFLETLGVRDRSLAINTLEITRSRANEQAFEVVCRRFGIDPPAVPVVLIGESVLVGYGDEATSGEEIRSAITRCRTRTCRDVGAGLIAGPPTAGHPDQPGNQPSPATEAHPRALPNTISVPLLGEIEPRALSLPALTVLLGAIDGFNPCAMWVLVFLVGLLSGIGDKLRKWSYGALFLATSGLVYFLFMTAWLNLFLVLGSVAVIRDAVGAFAIAAGGYYLWQFVANPEAACPVTSPEKRQRVLTRLSAAVAEPSFLLGAAGLVVLAVAVNVIELLCSAGIPAIYTQVLAMSVLSPVEHAAYLALYITMFMLDDVIVFVTAMLALEATGLTGSYARFSHLIGGLVLGVIGVLLIVRPEWLTLA